MSSSPSSIIIRKVSEAFGFTPSKGLSEDWKQTQEELEKLVETAENASEPTQKPNDNEYSLKYIAKHRAKQKIKTKFKIGRYYFQRIKPKDGSANIVIKYQCIKTIYSVKDIQMNIVIMKQITPYNSKKYTLDRHACEKFHIKYQPGLEIWPMEMNWIPERKDQTPYYLYYK